MPISPEILSKELLVALEIYEATEKTKEPIHFNSLVDRMAGRASRATVSRSLDMLFDQGIVRAEWITRKDGRYIRSLTIAGEARDFLKEIHKRIAKHGRT